MKGFGVRAAGGGGGAAAGGGGGAACRPSRMAELNGEFVDASGNGKEFQANFAGLRRINDGVQNTLSGGPGAIETVRRDLLGQVVNTPGVKAQSFVILSEMLESMPLGSGGEAISDDKITEAHEDVFTELTSDVPLTTAITSVGNLFLSLYYRNNPLRIAAAGAAAAGAGLLAWEGGIGRVAGLSVGACSTLLAALMTGYGYVIAPGAAPQPAVPQGPLPFNVSNFEEYWRVNMNQQNILPADRAIIDDIRSGLIAELKSPRNIAYAVADLSCRLVDKIFPAGAGFQPFQRFNMQPPAAGLESPFNTFIRTIRDGAAGFLNYLLGLLDVVRKVPYQRVGVVGHEDQSISYNMRLKMTDLIANLFASFRAQGVAIGMIDEKFMELYLSSLINMIFPSEMLFSARIGNNYEARKQLLFLIHKIRDRVIRRWTTRRGDDYTEEILLQIFPCFRSRLTELALKLFERDDPLAFVYDLPHGDSMEVACSGSQDPRERDETIVHDWFIKSASGSTPVFAVEEQQYEAMKRQEGALTRLVLHPDGAFRTVSSMFSGACGQLGLTTHQQVLNLVEEVAKIHTLPMPHKFPPEILMFLSNIQAVIAKIHEVVQKGQAEDVTRDEILQEYTKFGDVKLVSEYVKSIVTLSRVWTPRINRDIFTLAVKRPTNGGDPYPVVILNLNSIPGYTVQSGIIKKVEIPTVMLLGLGEKFVKTVGGGASNLAGRTWGMLCSWARPGNPPAAGDMDVGSAPPPPPSAGPISLKPLEAPGGGVAAARDIQANIDECNKLLADSADQAIIPEIVELIPELKAAAAGEASEEAVLQKQHEDQLAAQIAAADDLPELIRIAAADPRLPPSKVMTGSDLGSQPLPDDLQETPEQKEERLKKTESVNNRKDRIRAAAKKAAADNAFASSAHADGMKDNPGGGSRRKSSKNVKRTRRRNKGRLATKYAKQSRRRTGKRSSRKGRK